MGRASIGAFSISLPFMVCVTCVVYYSQEVGQVGMMPMLLPIVDEQVGA